MLRVSKYITTVSLFSADATRTIKTTCTINAWTAATPLLSTFVAGEKDDLAGEEAREDAVEGGTRVVDLDVDPVEGDREEDEENRRGDEGGGKNFQRKSTR